MLSVNYISVKLEKLNQLINVRRQQFPLSLSFSFLAIPAPVLSYIMLPIKHQNVNLVPSILQYLEVADMVPQGITQDKWVKQPWPGCCVCWQAPLSQENGSDWAAGRRHCSSETKNSFRLSGFIHLFSPGSNPATLGK